MEQKAIHYTASYVIIKLEAKYSKQKNEKGATCVREMKRPRKFQVIQQPVVSISQVSGLALLTVEASVMLRILCITCLLRWI